MLRTFRITVDGHAYEVTVEEITEGGRLIPQPGDMRVPQSPRASNTPAGTSGPARASEGRLDAPAGAQTSPLAGVVEAIAVAVGDEVEVGAVVATLEAMKMKTSVVATRSGRVSQVLVRAGQSVDVGQTLLLIE